MDTAKRPPTSFLWTAGRWVTPIAVAAMAMSGTLAPSSARAEVPAPSIYFGGYIGGNWVTDDWDLGLPPDRGIPPSSGLSLGGRAGFHVAWWLAIEGSFGFLPFKSRDRNTNLGTNLALSYSADALFKILDKHWTPYVDVGVGGYHNVAGDYGEDIDYNLHWGLGFSYLLNDWIGLRADARHYITDGSNGDFSANNLEFTVGVDFFVFDLTPAKEPMNPTDDPDGDGVTNKGDDCPMVAGPPEAKGCPDSDGDGISDTEDVCPKVAGGIERSGCPVPKRLEPEPEPEPEPIKPMEEEPATPPAAPVDSDGDGVNDPDDACPNDAGSKYAKGCPDKDDDGVPDSEDKCPDEAGAIEEGGCVPKAVAEAFGGSLQGINFRTGSADILKSSKATLDGVIDVLTKFKSIHARVEGHTDSKGDDAKNQQLSQLRADTVKRYLIYRGISKDRLTSQGFGESQPVASNRTKKGRAKNRRIVFKIVTH